MTETNTSPQPSAADVAARNNSPILRSVHPDFWPLPLYEAGRELGMGRAAVDKARDAGRLKAYKQGNRWMTQPRFVREYLENAGGAVSA